jgi:hypothetical protein
VAAKRNRKQLHQVNAEVANRLKRVDIYKYIYIPTYMLLFQTENGSLGDFP